MTSTARAKRITGYALVFFLGCALGLVLRYGANLLDAVTDVVFPWFFGWVVGEFLLVFVLTACTILLSFRWRGARRVLMWGVWLSFLLSSLFMWWVLIGFAMDHPAGTH